MALFTDGLMATVEHLAEHDSGVLELAASEGIDLTRKLALAQEEIGVELAALLPRISSFDLQFLFPGSPGLGGVVVTAPLRLWHAFHALALVYRDAYHKQLNDRYEGKWKEYVELAKWAAEKLMQTGVGIASDPVPQAAQPEVGTTAGSLPEGTYYVTAAWLNANQEEGLSAVPQSIAVSAGNTFHVRTGAAGANAHAWNVYAGVSMEDMVRQNPAPLAMDETWVQGSPLLTHGPNPGGGQRPSFLRALPRILQRG